MLDQIKVFAVWGEFSIFWLYSKRNWNVWYQKKKIEKKKLNYFWYARKTDTPVLFFCCSQSFLNVVVINGCEILIPEIGVVGIWEELVPNRPGIYFLFRLCNFLCIHLTPYPKLNMEILLIQSQTPWLYAKMTKYNEPLESVALIHCPVNYQGCYYLTGLTTKKKYQVDQSVV